MQKHTINLILNHQSLYEMCSEACFLRRAPLGDAAMGELQGWREGTEVEGDTVMRDDRLGGFSPHCTRSVGFSSHLDVERARQLLHLRQQLQPPRQHAVHAAGPREVDVRVQLLLSPRGCGFAATG